MVGRGGTVDSSQRDYGELGAVEQVEPGSAVVDEGGLAVAWQEFTVRTAKSSMSVSSVTRQPFGSHRGPQLLTSTVKPRSYVSVGRRFSFRYCASIVSREMR